MNSIKAEVKNALSIDLEDWYHGVLQIDYANWHQYENRLEKNLITILNLLNKYHTQATFFILGHIADKFPGFVKLIAENGHEIASHGYNHRPIFEQTPQEFKEDVLRSKKVIESLTNVAIEGYRAPFFSVTKKSLWALNILKELDFKYDSSIFPTKNFLYGIPDAPQAIYRIKENGLIEFPLSVVKVLGANLPISGGFYLRTLPYSLMKLGLLSYNHKGYPAIIYIHPWELDVDKPKIPIRLPRKWRFIYEHNTGNKFKNKFELLMKDFKFTSISEVLNAGCGE